MAARVQRIFPVAPPADVEVGGVPGHGHGLEYRANQWIVGALFLFLMMTFFPTTSLVIFFIFVVGISGCVGVGLRIGQAQMRAGNLNSGPTRHIMRSLWGGASFLGLPQTTDMTNFGLMFINGDFNESHYEMLIRLDENQDRRETVIPQPLLDAFPSYKYGKTGQDTSSIHSQGHSRGHGQDSSGPEVCTICLETLTDGDSVRTLPCMHPFHDQCIMKWVQQQGMTCTCPVCNTQVFG